MNRRQRKRPLTVWELPSLLLSVHEHRRSPVPQPKERPHFIPVLAFVYRSRYVVASQVQRRFASAIKSDRTARRHLAEMQSLGWIDTVRTRSTSPLWPKVYHLTGRGATRLRKALKAKGRDTHLIRNDRSRTNGHSADHVVHEVLTTEFLLSLQQSVDATDGVELLRTERRSLAKHPSFRVKVKGRRTRLIPDAMYLRREKGRGMICSFLEIDTGTMRREQIEAKFARYEAWDKSRAGNEYLLDLYRQYGSKNPKPAFRIALVVCGDPMIDEDHRLAALAEVGRENAFLRRRIWITTGSRLNVPKESMFEGAWIRTTDEVLHVFGRESFDCVHVDSVLGIDDPEESAPEIVGGLTGDALGQHVEEVRLHLFELGFHLLRDDGTFILDDTVYLKTSLSS